MSDQVERIRRAAREMEDALNEYAGDISVHVMQTDVSSLANGERYAYQVQAVVVTVTERQVYPVAGK